MYISGPISLHPCYFSDCLFFKEVLSIQFCDHVNSDVFHKEKRLGISFVAVSIKIHVYDLPLQNHVIKVTTT